MKQGKLVGFNLEMYEIFCGGTIDNRANFDTSWEEVHKRDKR
jgi:hypothetical protein